MKPMRSDLYIWAVRLLFARARRRWCGQTPLTFLWPHRDGKIGPGIRGALQTSRICCKIASPASPQTSLQGSRQCNHRGSGAVEVFDGAAAATTRAVERACLPVALLLAFGIWWFTRPDPPRGEDYPLADLAGYPQRWARHLNLPVSVTDETGIEFAFIPPGRFRMGSPDEEIQTLVAREPGDDLRTKKLAEKSRPMEIARPFYLGATEVTIGQFRRYAETRKEKTHGEKYGIAFGLSGETWVTKDVYSWRNTGDQSAADDIPVGNITFAEAEDFCNWLNGLTKAHNHRLPTEAEWEYACRAGTLTPYCCGDQRTLERYARFKANSKNRLHPVRSREPNAFGLFDMHGNHAEWCGLADVNSPLFTPIPGGDPNDRPSRGGSFLRSAERVRSAARNWGHRDSMDMGGFRVLKEIRD